MLARLTLLLTLFIATTAWAAPFTNIQLRRDTPTNWTNYNPILKAGEPGCEMTGNPARCTAQKIGDGVTAWSQLPYVSAPWVDDRAVSALADADALAVAGGKRLVITRVWTTVPATLSAPSVTVIPGGQLAGTGTTAIAGQFEGSPGCFGASRSVSFTGDMEQIIPQWFGMKADQTGTSAPLQQAINSAVNSGVPLYIPEGRYKITTNLTLPTVAAGQRLVIRGSGPGTVLIGYKSLGVTKVLELGQTSPQATTDLHISDLAIAGSGDSATDVTQMVDYGVHGLYVNHSNFARITASFCSTAGMRIESGWSNNFDNLKLQYNQIGFLGRTAFNQNSFTHCKFWLNQIGLVIGQGQGNKISNGLFESNAKTGAYIVASYAASFDSCYFEGNAKVSTAPGTAWPAGMTAGITVGTPATTIKADIVVDAGSSLPVSGIPTSITEMAIFAPSQGITISGCSTAVYTSAAESFVYVIGVSGLDLTNNYNSTTAVPMVKGYQNGAYCKMANVTASDNTGFSANFAFDNPVDGRRAYSVSPDSIVFKSAGKTNYAETNFAKWGAYDAVVGTFTLKDGTDKYNRRSPVWALAYANTAVTEVRGFTMDPAAYPQNIGKTFVFLMDIKAQNAGTSVNLYGKRIEDPAFAVTTEWATYANYFVWPASGGPFVMGGISKVGNAGEVYVANPVLIEVGGDYRDIIGRAGETVTFYSTAAPLVGTWRIGDRVINSAPTVGQAKSWVCTVAGSPGTWVSEGNL